MKVALIGLPQSGKTTLFQTLTGVDAGREKAGLSIGTVKVPDARVDRLAEIYKPKKTTHAVIEIVEAHTPHKSEKKTNESALDAAFLNVVKPMDAFLLVARAFDEEGLREPASDVETVIGEMVLADMMLVETRLERDELDRKKGKAGMIGEERTALERCKALLDAGKLLHADAELSAEPLLRTYAFLTARPILIAVNGGEDVIGQDPAQVLAKYGLPVHGLPAFSCCAKVEEEIQGLPEEERAGFREAMGIEEPVLEVMVRQMYDALGLISFLTAGEDECRAWTIRRGTPAPRAAGAVHTDIEKGFIRAEIIAYDEFIVLGSEAAAKKAGRYRLEGKEYVVRDGDIVHFRFNL